MAFSRERILESLARLRFVDAGELAIILGEPLATVHRALIALLQDDLAHRVSHGTVHLPSSHRYYLTGQGIAAAADALDYDAPSEFVRAYPVSRQWLSLPLRRMDAVASVYRLAATLSPGLDGLETRVEFQRRCRFDAVMTLHNGRSFGGEDAITPDAVGHLLTDGLHVRWTHTSLRQGYTMTSNAGSPFRRTDLNLQRNIAKSRRPG